MTGLRAMRGRWRAFKNDARASLLRGVARQLRRGCERKFEQAGGERNLTQIPIFINNRNRLTYLQMMLKSLEQAGQENITILDNDSTYEPLQEFYRTTSHQVIKLGRNVGPLALWDSGLYKKIRKSFFVYSDADVVPVDDCPADFMAVFYRALLRFPGISKVGFGLRLDDIPSCFNKRDDVIKWESQFWKSEVAPGLFAAAIDTTFALYRPWTHPAQVAKCLRTGGKYVARHMPWYADSGSPSEEDRFYEATITPKYSWWVGGGEQRIAVMKAVSSAETAPGKVE